MWIYALKLGFLNAFIRVLPEFSHGINKLSKTCPLFYVLCIQALSSFLYKGRDDEHCPIKSFLNNSNHIQLYQEGVSCVGSSNLVSSNAGIGLSVFWLHYLLDHNMMSLDTWPVYLCCSW